MKAIYIRYILTILVSSLFLQSVHAAEEEERSCQKKVVLFNGTKHDIIIKTEYVGIEGTELIKPGAAISYGAIAPLIENFTVPFKVTITREDGQKFKAPKLKISCADVNYVKPYGDCTEISDSFKYQLNDQPIIIYITANAND